MSNEKTTEHSKPIGTWKFFDPKGKTLFEGSYDDLKKVADKYDSEEKTKTLALKKADENRQAAEETKALAELNKSWAKKQIKGVDVFYDKKTKSSWTDFLGASNWFNAGTKCRRMGMALPTAQQLQTAIENGLLSFVETQYPLLWTQDDKTANLGREISMMMENHDALGVSADGNIVPQKKRDDVGIVCVKR